MNIISTPINLSAYILSFEHIDLDNLEKELQPFLVDNKKILKTPLYFHHTEKSKLTLPELSIFFDTLKDLNIYIAGVISEEKSVRKFSKCIGVPSFSNFKSISKDTFNQQNSTSNLTPTANTSVDLESKQAMTSLSHLESQHALLGSSTQTTQADTVNQNQLTASMENNISQQKNISQNISVSEADRHSMMNTAKKDEEYQNEGKSTYKPVNDLSFNKPKSDDISKLNQLKNNSQPTTATSQRNLPSQNNNQEDINNFVEHKHLTEPGKRPLIINEVIPEGKTIRHQGDIVLLKALLKRSVVNATGSVHCYDKVEGTILAGSSGNTSAKIYSTDLDAEAIAIAGFYAKKYQYVNVLAKSKMLMIALKESNLNFSSIQMMPVIKGVMDFNQIPSPQVNRRATPPSVPTQSYSSSPPFVTDREQSSKMESSVETPVESPVAPLNRSIDIEKESKLMKSNLPLSDILPPLGS